MTSPSFISLHLPGPEMAKCEGVYCCFTRTISFTTTFTHSLMNLLSIPSFVLIKYCLSELHAHLYHYRNIWPEVVYCCFT